MRKDATELKRFLRANLYRHYKVNRMRVKASRIVRELFDASWPNRPCCRPIIRTGDDVSKQARKIADYIAGMTDRYAIREHRRLYSSMSCTRLCVALPRHPAYLAFSILSIGMII
jgi:dGTPase